MRPIIFVARDEYEGNEELINIHILPDYVLFTVAFDDETTLLLNFYKERSDFDAGNSIGKLYIRLSAIKEFGDEVIIEALDYVDNCSMYAAASRIVANYMTTMISLNKRIYTRELGEFVKAEYDKYLRECVSIFIRTDEGKELLENYFLRSKSREKKNSPTL